MKNSRPMKVLKTRVIAFALASWLSASCATMAPTAVGCATGAAAGVIVGVARVAGDKDSADQEKDFALTAAFGLVTGCIAGFFAGMRATARERERAEAEKAKAQPKPAPVAATSSVVTE